MKNSVPPPLRLKVVYIWNVDFFDFGFDPHPPLWTFSTIWDIFYLACSPNQKKTENLKSSNAGTRNVKKPKTVENKPDHNMIKNMQKFWRDCKLNKLGLSCAKLRASLGLPGYD